MNREVRTVPYHSELWNALVEGGWFTWTVENGIATMYRKGS